MYHVVCLTLLNVLPDDLIGMQFGVTMGYHSLFPPPPPAADRYSDVRLEHTREAEASSASGPAQQASGTEGGVGVACGDRTADDSDGVCCVQGRGEIVSVFLAARALVWGQGRMFLCVCVCVCGCVLMLARFDVFHHVILSELLNCNWKKGDKDRLAPNVCRLIRRTNEVREGGVWRSSSHFLPH